MKGFFLVLFIAFSSSVLYAQESTDYDSVAPLEWEEDEGDDDEDES